MSSSRVRLFRRKFFPDASTREWNDWRWQLRHSIRGLEALERVLHLSADERSALERSRNSLPNRITPYYASLLDRDDPTQPLRRTMVMVNQEFVRTPDEKVDADRQGRRPRLAPRSLTRLFAFNAGRWESAATSSPAAASTAASRGCWE